MERSTEPEAAADAAPALDTAQLEGSGPRINVKPLLRLMSEKKASDLFLTSMAVSYTHLTLPTSDLV